MTLPCLLCDRACPARDLHYRALCTACAAACGVTPAQLELDDDRRRAAELVRARGGA